MSRKINVFGALGLGLALAFAVFVWLPGSGAAITLQPDDRSVVARGETLYRSHCAQCHGQNLEGQPNWRSRDAEGYLPAPPHDETGHSWHHADTLLFKITKLGTASIAGPDYKTRMPAYADVLSDKEIIAVLSYIKSRWPKQTRRRHDQINEAAKGQE
jgi:mono/diheme cytochrome c family protein